ncbi:MAG: M1 family metallopeptidase [Gemmatimonadales bacterium]|nr:M1 family metallopeptidase [Gemmatimonadales bacterium]
MTAIAAAEYTAGHRAIRRDIPMTNSIMRAHAAGTRDSSGRPGANYWQIRTDYTIAATIDPATQRISGSEKIVLHNRSGDSLRTVVLRLDPNIFRGTSPRGFSVPAENTDGMVITKLSVNGQAVDLAAAPARGGTAPTAPRINGLTSTVATILLPTAIAAHAQATLEIEWNHKLPGGPGGQGHRMTQRWGDSLFQPTQWYPRVAKYDDLRGWDTEVYLGPSEFYNNFGTFDVAITMPAGWIVSGTGVLQNPEQVLTATARERLSHVLESDAELTIVGPDEVGPGRSTAAGSRLTWRFHADTVNDFAWATAPNFVWKATRATIPGVGAVPIHMVFLPGRAAPFARAGQITRHALEFYSKLWFPYAFPQLTLQDGPSAGMEYPMVINSNAGAADHETGHQWWPMVVGNNETQYGWMDEGFNQYMNILSNADAASRVATFNGLGQSYGNINGDEGEPPMMWSANYGGPMYGFQTYAKTPLMLSMLGGIVGDSAVQRAMGEWGTAWRFKHPSPWDFMFFMNRALGRDLGWFWNAWLFNTDAAHQSIEEVTTGANGLTKVVVRQAGQMPAPVVLLVQFASEGPPIKQMAGAEMVSSISARVTMPVDVWFSGSRTAVATLDFGPRKIQRIILDPACRFPDRDHIDNVWPRPEVVAPGRPYSCQ